MTRFDIPQAMQRGVQQYQAGKLAEAESIFGQVLATQPNHPGALQALGVIAAQTGRFDEAVKLLRKSVQVQPSSAHAHYNLGNALRDAGRAGEAIGSFRDAIRLQPRFADAHHNLANLLRDKGLVAEALAGYREAVRINPDYAEAHNSMGMAFDLQESWDAAIECYRAALRIDPNYVDPRNNLGVTLRKQQRLDEAVAELRQATEIKPEYAPAWSNLGHTLRELGLVKEAMASYRRAIERDASSPDVPTAMLFTSNHLASEDPLLAVKEHRAWAERYAPSPQFSNFANDRSPTRRLRIGYVSADFRRHSVAYFIGPLLQNHDPQAVEVFAYSNVKKPDTATDRIKALAQAWHDIVDLRDDEAAALIHTHAIDILVDLSGHTDGHRLGIFARKPAPIQVTYLGYPNTTGLATIDYRLTDSFADAPGLADKLCVEKLWRLPDCAWCYQPPGDAPDVQLSTGRKFTFGSFNALPKISSEIITVWAEVLKAVPDSHLLIKSAGTGAASARVRLSGEFEKRGVSSDRLELLGHIAEGRRHFDIYHRVDVALDSYPYHGTTTTCESMWMGLPVVTLAGQTHVSRVGVSLLSNVGLPELVAETQQDYVRIAAELAGDAVRRNELRAGMRARLLLSPLMDAPRFARNVEAAYRAMWEKWCLAAAG